MSLVTPSKVQKLQRTLYVKAKSEAGFKFYSLYDKVYRPDVMREAWKRVKANGGSAGADGVTFEAIEEACRSQYQMEELGLILTSTIINSFFHQDILSLSVGRSGYRHFFTG